MEHSQRILNILKEKNISAYRIAKETHISESLFSKWNTSPTSEISSKNLVKIADYLNCSIDYLLGRTDIPTINSIQKSMQYSEIAAFGGTETEGTQKPIVEETP